MPCHECLAAQRDWRDRATVLWPDQRPFSVPVARLLEAFKTNDRWDVIAGSSRLQKDPLRSFRSPLAWASGSGHLGSLQSPSKSLIREMPAPVIGLQGEIVIAIGALDAIAISSHHRFPFESPFPAVGRHSECVIIAALTSHLQGALRVSGSQGGRYQFCLPRALYCAAPLLRADGERTCR